MIMKTLAICIPTYNRAKYLLKMLETICAQVTDKNRELIQICVSDNASEEDYTDVIEFMEKSGIEFVYKRAERNYGADKNFLKAVEIANAEYCWLAGDDDGIVNGAIDIVLDYITHNKDISVFWGNRVICNKNLKPFMKEYWTKNRTTFIVDFSDKTKIISYFNQLNSTTSLGYLTSLIVKKCEWDEQTVACEEYVGTIYVQVAQYLSMLKTGKKMMCISECIALSRFGNDGFYKNLKQRIYMDYYGFLSISNIFKNDKEVINSLLGIVRRHYNDIFLAALGYASHLEEKEIDVLKRIGYSETDIKIFERNKGQVALILIARIIKSMFLDFRWFFKTCFITLQKL